MKVTSCACFIKYKFTFTEIYYATSAADDDDEEINLNEVMFMSFDYNQRNFCC